MAVNCRDGTGDCAHKFDVSQELITLSMRICAISMKPAFAGAVLKQVLG